jgi:hypothetical protein
MQATPSRVIYSELPEANDELETDESPLAPPIPAEDVDFELAPELAGDDDFETAPSLMPREDAIVASAPMIQRRPRK